MAFIIIPDWASAITRIILGAAAVLTLAACSSGTAAEPTYAQGAAFGKDHITSTAYEATVWCASHDPTPGANDETGTWSGSKWYQGCVHAVEAASAEHIIEHGLGQ